MGAVDVVLAEGGIGVGDAYELDLGVRREVVEEALDVAVDEADDGYSDGCGGLGGGFVGCEAGGEDGRGEEEFGEAHRDGFQCNALALAGDGQERSRLRAMPTLATMRLSRRWGTRR
jgi:hypothetical protein